MHDQTLLILILVVLVVVAVAMAVQAFALVSALHAVRRFEARFGEVERELQALRPRLDRLGKVIDNVADWTDGAAEHIPRVAADIESALDQIRWVGRVGAMVLVKPLRPLGKLIALWKGLRVGAHAYRQVRPGPVHELAPPRASEL